MIQSDASEPDVRGWDVRTVGGRQLGRVHDLIVDRAAGGVLLDVDVLGAAQHAYVPRRVVEIDATRHLVLMDSADLPVSELRRDPEVERRRMQRRKIDRLSTDL